MAPSDRKEQTKESLLARTEHLCAQIHDDRSADPWGTDSYLSTILRLSQLAPTSEYSETPALPPQRDYFSSAQRELGIRDAAMGAVKATQELSALIREVQELWLFGGLDTLRSSGGAEEAERVAEVGRVLARIAGGEGEGKGVKVEKDG